MATFGSARHNEFGGISGGQRGDQTGDEVCTQEAYLHSSGWDILRANDLSLRTQLANKMLQACNNSNVGYDQPERELIYTDTTSSSVPTHCDCSSLVCQIVRECGIQCNNFSTHTEIQELLSTGQFTQVQYTSLDDLETGDILVDSSHTHHTGIITQGRQLQWIYDVGVRKYFADRGTEQQNNGLLFYYFFSSRGVTYSLQSICGMLGNIVAESTVNPGLQETGQTTGSQSGHGLTQWTPGSELIDWCSLHGWNWYDGNAQCEKLAEEMETNAGQWLNSVTHPEYHYTQEQYRGLTNVEECVRAFCWQYERPRDDPETLHMERRISMGQWFYEYLSGQPEPPDPPEPPTPPPPTEYHSMPLWFYLKRKI